MYHFRMNLLIFSIAVVAFLSGSGSGLTDKSRYKLTYCWMLRDSAEYYEYRLDTKCYLAVDFFDEQVIKKCFKCNLFIKTFQIDYNMAMKFTMPLSRYFSVTKSTMKSIFSSYACRIRLNSTYGCGSRRAI
jgi:hypothetical protein